MHHPGLWQRLDIAQNGAHLNMGQPRTDANAGVVGVLGATAPALLAAPGAAPAFAASAASAPAMTAALGTAALALDTLGLAACARLLIVTATATAERLGDTGICKFDKSGASDSVHSGG